MSTSERELIDRLDGRITKLEELLTHLQRTVDDLNGVVLQAQKRLDALTSETTRLGQELLHFTDAREEVRSPAEERPPHY